MGLNLNLNGSSVGERIVIGLAVIALCAEMLSDNGACTPSPPRAELMTHEQCLAVCYPSPIRRIESYACTCENGQQ